MHAFDVLGDPVRRRILELLRDGELTSGAVCEVIRREFGISQPAVSQHLKVLKEAGLVFDRPAGTRRVYHVDPQAVAALREYFDAFWGQALKSFRTAAEAPHPDEEETPE